MVKRVKICPKCGSRDISITKGFLPGIIPGEHVCQNCGFVSVLFPEVSLEEAKKIKVKKIRPEEKPLYVDIKYGKFVVKFWWKIFGPLSIILGILVLFDWFNISSLVIRLITGFTALLFGVCVAYLSYMKEEMIKKYRKILLLWFFLPYIFMILFLILDYFKIPI